MRDFFAPIIYVVFYSINYVLKKKRLAPTVYLFDSKRPRLIVCNSTLNYHINKHAFGLSVNPDHNILTAEVFS